MKVIIAILISLLLVLQYKLWVGEGSMAEVSNLRQGIAEQTEQNAILKDRNEALNAEVVDLKQGVEAMEERARTELGMIKKDETFFQIIDE